MGAGLFNQIQHNLQVYNWPLFAKLELSDHLPHAELALGELHVPQVQGPGGAVDLHDLRDGDQREATQLQLGTTPSDQLAEDQLGLQQNDVVQEGLWCRREARLRWEETDAAYGRRVEGSLQSRTTTRLFKIHLRGFLQGEGWAGPDRLVRLALQGPLRQGQIHQLAFQVDRSGYLRQVVMMIENVKMTKKEVGTSR